MLLFFWKARGLNSGNLSGATWYHHQDSVPRFVCTGQYGVSIVNPLIHSPGIIPECSYITDGNTVVDTCLYDDTLFTATSSGVGSIDWNNLMSSGCDIVDPVDLTPMYSIAYNDQTGLPSNNVVALACNNTYFSALTTSGLFITDTLIDEVFPITSGIDVALSSNNLYLSYPNRVVSCSLGDLGNWADIISSTNTINHIYVHEYTTETLFIATISGVVVVDTDGQDYYTTFSGSSEISSIVFEYDASRHHGHLLCLSSTGVSVVNLQAKTIDAYIPIPSASIAAVGHVGFSS